METPQPSATATATATATGGHLPTDPPPTTVPVQARRTPVIPPERPGTATGAGEGHRVMAFMPPQPERVCHTRHLVASMLRLWRLEHLRDAAELVTSELVTNAIQHSPDQHPITVTIEHDEQWLSIAVRDRSAGVPRLAGAGVSDEHGRGLLLVGHVAGAWLCEAHADGTKTVSCRLALWPPQPADLAIPARPTHRPLLTDGRDTHLPPPRPSVV
ncbi:ATP-binding protein [Kitasatospora sp. NPDC052896]|uniref:ATP-binding protein n=1 Tax=Kitasatospora sp. NPDC052896 TaxID=3364061 RepID=UPI0037C8416D